MTSRTDPTRRIDYAGLKSEIGALKTFVDELGALRAFDLNRDRIYAVAAKVYGRGHKGSYDLLPQDFE